MKFFFWNKPNSASEHGSTADGKSIALNEHSELKTLRAKLKRERQDRDALKEDLRQRNKSMAELERKYRALRVDGRSPDTCSCEARVAEFERMARSRADSGSIRKQIESYHATLSKKGYNYVWAERIEAILEVVTTGELSLPRALAKIRRNEERKRKMGLESYPWIINDAPVDMPWRPAAAAYRSAIVECVMDHVQPNTRKVIETGSGWGEHLCNIYLEGGPEDAVYYACELEEEGRKCAELLGSLDAEFTIKPLFFDYCNPDWAEIPKDDEHTILLTAHSIEQVSTIHDDVIYGALGLSKEVTGIHFEPVGWQTYEKSSWTDISARHFARCAELNYNKNLWPLLQRIQNKGLIEIETVLPNFIGLDYNPATLIVWRKVA